MTLEVTISDNSQAMVSVPKIGLKNIAVKAGGKTIWQDSSYVEGVVGITGGRESANYVTIDVGSGSHAQVNNE